METQMNGTLTGKVAFVTEREAASVVRLQWYLLAKERRVPRRLYRNFVALVQLRGEYFRSRIGHCRR
jgi:hypothetical protein